MQLRSLALVNFCQHRDLTVEFPVGITGIVGSNGSGKSTIAQALRFALLGESGNAGAKVDDLNWAATLANESGSVEWLFEKDGTEGKLKRAIQVARASLRFGELKANSVSAVNDEIMKLVGVSKRTLEDIVFVMQGKIERVLFDRPAERKKNFHALFGVDKAETIRELLRRELTMLGVPPTDERVAQLQQRLDEEIDPKLKELLASKTGLDTAMQGFDSASFQKVVDAFNLAQSIEEQIGSTAKAIDALENIMSMSLSEIEPVKLAMDAAHASMLVKKAGIDKLRGQLSGMASARKLHETVKRLKAESEAMEVMATEAAPTPPEIDQATIDQADHDIAVSRAEIEPKRTFIRVFQSAATDAICPTCGQNVHEPAELAEQMRIEVQERLAKIESVTEAANNARALLRVYLADAQRHQLQVTEAKKSLADIRTYLAELGDVEYNEGEEAALQATLDTFVAEEAAYDQLKNTLSMKTESFQHASGKHVALKEQLGNLYTQLSASPAQQAYDDAVMKLSNFDFAKNELANVTGQLSQLQSHRASTLGELEQLKEQAAKMEATKKYESLCERARSLLHHDCLPQVATQAYLAGLNAQLSKYLTIFEVPFSCTIKDDLSVMCCIPGIGEKPADRLSGGQKVMLSLAFRFSVYNMFALDLGFMLLDEPTSMLDTDRVASVVEVLQAVRRHARNTGMQLIVITHEEELKAAFDHTVQL
jgi:DNA repair exonuclease SbcCD ATPase subunit